jgi:hypothetical protein
MRGPRLLSTALKLSVAAALMAWMIHSGKLDAGQVAAAVRHWRETAGVVLTFIVTIAITAWRWNLLLKAQGVRIGFRDAFSLTMIGLLFNTVIPGSVGGDVIKGYYIAARAPGRRGEALATILVDRILGLLSLLTVASAATVFSLDLLRRHQALAALATFTLAATAAAAAVFAVAVFSSRFSSAALDRLSHRLPLSRLASRGVGVLLPYRDRPATVLAAYAVGVPGHLLACIGFYLAAQAVGGHGVPMSYFLLLVPLGLLTTAIPLAPAGIGIGQAAFYTLFQLARPGLGALGANACTVYQFVLVLVYLSGFCFYLGYRAQPVGESVPSARALAASGEEGA